MDPQARQHVEGMPALLAKVPSGIRSRGADES
jgi:hypothetical protein